jgi:hypothetical protein
MAVVVTALTAKSTAGRPYSRQLEAMGICILRTNGFPAAKAFGPEHDAAAVSRNELLKIATFRYRTRGGSELFAWRHTPAIVVRGQL